MKIIILAGEEEINSFLVLEAITLLKITVLSREIKSYLELTMERTKYLMTLYSNILTFQVE